MYYFYLNNLFLLEQFNETSSNENFNMWITMIRLLILNQYRLNNDFVIFRTYYISKINLKKKKFELFFYNRYCLLL